jgi:uncharacterized membrane protein
LTLETYLLVVASAGAHAYWNFLLKRSGGTQVFTGLSKIVEGLVFLVLLTTGLLIDLPALSAAWILPVVGAALVIANYVLLTLAYGQGDLSVVYPISRGAVLIFLPPLAYVVMGERLDTTGWIALGLILTGIACIQSLKLAGNAAAGFALLAAVVAAGYTVWDKRAVQVLSPIGYFAAYTVLTAIAYAAYLIATTPRTTIATAWANNRGPIIQVAALNSGSYLLALTALQSGKASYVIALRQLSIAGGAVLGSMVLRESLPPSRIIGILLVVAGAILLSLAR